MKVVKLTLDIILHDTGSIGIGNVRYGASTLIARFLLEAYNDQVKRLRLERTFLIDKLLSYCTTTNRKELEEHLAIVEENELANVDDVIRSYIKFFEERIL